MDDSSAVQRLKNGDIGGLDVIVTLHQQKAVRVAYLILHDVQLAEDVVQDTFVRIYQRIRHFDDTRPFEPYLLRSVINSALNAAKKNGGWVEIDHPDNPERLESLLSDAVSVEDQAEYTALKQEIASALDSLPPRQRAAVVQRYYLGMTEKEMAENLSTATGTVKWLLNAARNRLRNLLRPERRME